MRPRLVISDLKVRAHRSDRILLQVDDLSLAPGACLGLRGPSGAGKSTFLFALAGLAENASGRVLWDGQDILALSSEARAALRRRHIGMIFQDFLLFEELSADANAALLAAWVSGETGKEIPGRASRMLKRLGIGHGARTVESFSGGERQRVAVARALATAPAIILADEPTASLDRKTADLLVDDLLRLVREARKTMIAVSHDAAVHDRMDRVIDIVDGRIAADVTADA